MKPERSKAIEKALDTLARADRTRAEISDRLTKGGFDTQTTTEVLESLEEWGYLDDERLAQRQTRKLAEESHLGRLRIAAKLQQRGLEPELVEQIISTVSDEGERNRALKLLTKKFTTDPKDIPKAARHLASRGFDEETIRSALSAHFPAFED